MRIIRFVGDDGRAHYGAFGGGNLDGDLDEAAATGGAVVLTDPLGVLGPATSQKALFEGRKAIVADDDAGMRDLMSTVLERVGCTCVRCANGAEAMAALEREEPDLVVSDIVMPDHDGYAIYHAGKLQRPDLPIVLVTGFGYDPSHSVVRASSDGPVGVVYKPFTPEKLLDELAIAVRDALGSPREALVPTRQRHAVHRFLAPIRPQNIVCVGRNYFGAPVPADEVDARAPDDGLEVFMKPTTAVTGPGEAIRLPAALDMDAIAEAELAIVLGAEVPDDPERALDAVLGYTVAIDVTARRWQSPGPAPIWMRGKGFSTFCPIGPAITSADEIGDPDRLETITLVNGVEVRRGVAGDMAWSLKRIVHLLGTRLGVGAGTVILTGGPPLLAEGAPPALVPGDVVEGIVAGIGRLRVRVE